MLILCPTIFACLTRQRPPGRPIAAMAGAGRKSRSMASGGAPWPACAPPAAVAAVAAFAEAVAPTDRRPPGRAAALSRTGLDATRIGIGFALALGGDVVL